MIYGSASDVRAGFIWMVKEHIIHQERKFLPFGVLIFETRQWVGKRKHIERRDVRFDHYFSFHWFFLLCGKREKGWSWFHRWEDFFYKRVGWRTLFHMSFNLRVFHFLGGSSGRREGLALSFQFGSYTCLQLRLINAGFLHALVGLLIRFQRLKTPIVYPE